MDLESVADELYGLRPEEFTAARDQRAAQAREAGDRPLAEEIRALRRPSLAAWASNLLVREQPDEVKPLVQLGEGLRQAHRGLDGERLRELSRQQHALINALARQAKQLAGEAGHPISEDAQREVEQTLHAVLADDKAAQAWAAGRLTKSLDATTDFSVAAAETAPQRQTAAPRAPAKTPRRERDTAAEERRRQKLSRARRDAEEAERQLRERQEELAAADREAEEAAQLTEELRGRLEELARERESTKERHRRARTAEHEARDRARAADRAVRDATGRAEAATALVDRLTG
ncbi:hypothetical protein [Streptomyces sp. NPDC003006]